MAHAFSDSFAAWLDPTTEDVVQSLSNFSTGASGTSEVLQQWGIHDAAPDQRSPHQRAFVEREWAALRGAPRAGEATGLDDETLAVRLTHQMDNDPNNNDEQIAALLLHEEFQRLLGVEDDPERFLNAQRNILRQFGHHGRVSRMHEALTRAQERAVEASVVASQSVIELESSLLASNTSSSSSSSNADVKTEVIVWGDYADMRDSAPTRAPFFKTKSIASVCAGTTVSSVLTTTGDVYIWGSNPLMAASSVPRLLFPSDGIRIVQIACGRNHMLLLSNAGDVLGLGSNAHGQLGCNPAALEYTSTPQALVYQPPHASFLAAGDEHSACVAANGSLYAWGSNAHGQLGNSAVADYTDRPFPAELTYEEKIATVACGGSFTVALTNYGDVVQWGAVVPDPSRPTKVYPLPRQPVGLPAKAVMEVACGRAHVLALTNRGIVMSWGADIDGQLGSGQQTSLSMSAASRSRLVAPISPVHGPSSSSIATPSSTSASSSLSSLSSMSSTGLAMASIATAVSIGESVAQIAAGAHHSAAVTVRGEVYSWGRNAEGQLGLPQWHSKSSSVPILVGAASNFSVRHLACGHAHTVAVSSMIRPICFDVRGLLASGENSDVQVRIHDRVLSLHRCVLAARSAYFRQIFDAHPKLAALNITTISYDAFYPVVEYMYSGTAHVPAPLLEQVFVIARNLSIAQLERECQDILFDDNGNGTSSSSASSSLGGSSVYFFGGTRASSVDVQNAIQSLRSTGLLSDLTLTFPCGTAFAVHRAIVASRVPFFQQMLSSHWGKDNLGRLAITAVSADVFRHILDFAYGLPVSFSSETVIDVLLAANEYQVPQLQNHCELYISDAIDINNVLPLLQLSELASSYLYQISLDFAALHIAELETRKAFRSLPQSIRAAIAKRDRRTPTKVAKRPTAVSASGLLSDLADPMSPMRNSSEDEFDDDELAMYIRR